MPSIQKISFRADSSNLLKQNLTTPVIQQPIAQSPVSNKSEPVKNKTSFSGNKIAYVSSAIAIASLGVSAVLALRNGKFNKELKNVSKNSQDLASQISDKFTKIKQNFKSVDEKITRLGKWQDGQIDGVKNDLSAQISHIVTSVKSAGMEEIQVAPVNVNGINMNLATVLNGYGKHTAELETALRQESAKRIFGIVDRSNIVPHDDITIRVPTSEFRGITSTGGMSVVPKEVIANLGAIINNKQKTRLIVDTPLYLGQVEDNVYYSIAKRADGLFDYISSKDGKPIKGLQPLEYVNSISMPVYTDKGKTTEFVNIYISRNNEQTVDLKLLKPWLEKGLADELDLAVKSGGNFKIDRGLYSIEYNQNDIEPVAKIKYDTLFYKNDKFRMDGPVIDGSNKNIYNNLTHEAGETERFIYFDKFFYENLLRNAETSSENLKADLIIGNDWQTGGISAMMRLLTLAKKSFGLDPKVADNIYNTPVVTLMHNAGLPGNVWHSQPKLLNIMFGEHASMITKNAWMPKNSGLNADSLNALFHGNNLNPQTMASVYSDVVIPVSKGYGNEMAAHSGFGKANHDIFRMRARYHEFSDINHLKYIARENGLDPNLITDKNMAYRPITNGCDKINNILTEKKAREIEKAIGLKPESLRAFKQGDNILDWHNANKEVYLNKVIEEIDLARNGKGNPMNIELPEMTNLSGVTKDTMVVATAGRIVEQKGLDIFAESIEEFLSRHQGEDLPVFYAQGVGDKVFINKLLDVKKSVAAKFGQKAADRIVFARLFSEPGRYDGCKLMSDFTVMSSWFEPCGLVHKEIAGFNGAIPIVNKVGGLTDGLKDGVNAVFSEFKPKFDNYLDALNFNRHAFANALDKAFNIFKDKNRFAQVLADSYNADHSWLKMEGPMQEYAQLFTDMKVLKPEVLQHS